MKFLLAPAVLLMGAIPTPQKMFGSAVAFSLPLAVAVYLLYREGVAWYDPVILLAGASYVLALYMTFSFHLQVGSAAIGLSDSVDRFGSGDLGHRSVATRDEFADMVDDVGAISDRLAKVIRQVRASAHAINEAAREIAAGHVNLSHRTEQQASALEETASGMEELSSTVKQNAESCDLASGLSRQADQVARRGAQTVQRMVECMGLVDKSSTKIADIIGVIEGIAFQTNILALNAAVEAARAGEQGRGFAVVASEVRALAQKSALAAKEIKRLIEEAGANVSQGSKLVGEAGTIITEIVASVEKVAELVGQIAEASREQSSGVQEINRAITQMETMTQQNAALVEQATAGTIALGTQASNLIEATSQFKLADDGRAAEVVAPPEPRRELSLPPLAVRLLPPG